MPVHRDVGDIGQDLGRAVLPLAELEQFRRRVDEFGGVGVVQEGGVFEQVDDEIDVRRHPPDAEFAQGPVHAGNRQIRRLRPGGDLDQQRVVITGDHPARIGGAAIQADAHAGGAAIGGQAAIIGDEVVLRVFGGDAALHGMAMQADVVLTGHAGGLGQGLAFLDQDLRLHDVDAGHLFGDGMFDLDAGVHLDEEEFPRIHIHQEFDGAGAFIADMGADAAAQIADLGALFRRQVGGGRAFHHLLVAALHGAVPLEQVIDVAVLVAQDLHLDMAGAQDHLFQIALAIAKGGLGLAPAFADLVGQLLGAVDRAHAAPAAAPAGLQHQRIADFGGLTAHLVHVIAQHLGGGDHRHAGLDGHAPRRSLVAQRPHGGRRRADEGDARRFAGIDEIGVLGQQAIARVDGIGARQFRHADDFGDAQVSPHGRHPLADPVGLVGLEAVQAQLVFFGEDGHGFLAHLIGSPHDADGDLAPIGDEDLLEVGHGRTLRANDRLTLRVPRCGASAGNGGSRSESDVIMQPDRLGRKFCPFFGQNWGVNCPIARRTYVPDAPYSSDMIRSVVFATLPPSSTSRV